MSIHNQKTSIALLSLLDDLPNDEPISLKSVLDKLDGRAFGLLLFAIAVPNCIPNIPGISTIFGLLLIAPGMQMIFGSGKLWLPKQISEKKLDPRTIRTGIEKAVPILQKLERFIRPRLEILTVKPFTIILGIEVLILGGILILPIPFANMVPGLAVAMIALGLLQKDGLLILIANIIFILSIGLANLGVGAGVAAINWTIGAIADFFAHLFGT